MEPVSSTPPFSGLERLSQNERTASRVIDGKAVVITIDQNQVHVLNAVGTRVWQLADGRSLDAIIDEVVSEFEVARERAAVDVCSFARQLLALGAVYIQAAPVEAARLEAARVATERS